MSTYTDASLIVTPNAYKAGKLYSLKPTDGSGDLGVVRATTATYVGSDGLIKTALANEPRFDYSNGSCPSILVEPQRTNLLLRSEEFDNASWDKTNSLVISNQIISPDGNTTANKINETAISGYHLVKSNSSISGTYTSSVFAKKGERNFVMLWNDGTNSGRFFDLENGILGGTLGAVPLDSKIEDYGNGWYRCIITNNNATRLSIYTAISSTSAFYLGEVGKGIYIWGAQLEAGSNATSYIPTVASTVTRNRDVISKTGISDLIGQTEGTMFIDFLQITDGINIRGVFTLGETNNYIEMSVDFSGRIATRIIEGGVNRGVYNPLGELLGFNKFALAYTSNGYKLFKNGVKVYETSSTILPLVINNLYIGVNFFNNNVLNGEVKQAQIYKTALTDAECIALTTL